MSLATAILPKSNTRGPTVSNSETLSLFRRAAGGVTVAHEQFRAGFSRAPHSRRRPSVARQRPTSAAWPKAFPDRVTPELAKFIAEQDTAFLATATADGAPYVQHRGGPKGFIKVIDDRTLGFADYRGNRQYITLANLSENDRAFLFLLDPARRQRIKLWGRARVIENDPALSNGCSTTATRRGLSAPFFSRSRPGT